MVIAWKVPKLGVLHEVTPFLKSAHIWSCDSTRCHTMTCRLKSTFPNSSNIASFQGHCHLQCLITCSTQIWRGKVWEIWSHAVTSCRQRVHTGGVVPDCNNSSFTSTNPWHCEQWMVLVLPWERSGLHALWRTLQGTPLRFYQAPSPCVCHLSTNITACDQVSQAFPSILAHCKRSKTGGGNGLGRRLQATYGVLTLRGRVCTLWRYKH